SAPNKATAAGGLSIKAEIIYPEGHTQNGALKGCPDLSVYHLDNPSVFVMISKVLIQV
ncbi:hypothetical protein GBAR_LOCUS15117, partial [Geodia barretti]